MKLNWQLLILLNCKFNSVQKGFANASLQGAQYQHNIQNEKKSFIPFTGMV
jgi:hypothetical protein